MPQPMMAEQAAEPQEGQAPGGASKLVADIHSGMLKLKDLLDAKYPEDGQELNGIIQAYQSLIDGLGQAPGAKKPGPAMPATASPEAGVAQVKPAM